MVYFISDNHGHIKIGVTEKLNERIKQLQVGNPYPLTVIKTIRSYKYSDYDLEKWLHSYFSDFNCKTSSYISEWFEEKGKLSDFLNLTDDEISYFIYKNIQVVSKAELINYETIGGLKSQNSRLKQTINKLQEENEYLTTLLKIKEENK